MRTNTIHFAIITISIFLLMTISSAQTDSFTVSSPAISGTTERGYYSLLTSSGRIDSIYAAKDNAPNNLRSLPLVWKNAPEGTKSFALLMDDPDAKPVMQTFGMKGDAFIHWLAADIPPSLDSLKDNISMENPPFVQGKNGTGKIGYTGPKPPSNIPKNISKPIIHIYRITLYALSAPTGLKNGFTLEQFNNALTDSSKVLGKAHLYGSYNN